VARSLQRRDGMSLDRFKAPLATVGTGDTVEAAARIMRDRRVGCLVVTREGHPYGIVTDRDLVVRVMAEGIDPAQARVGDFATFDPITVSLEEGIETAVGLMRKHGVRRLPVVDHRGDAVGIVTADDLLVLLGGEIAAVCEGIENRSDATDAR
jgi:CBS domain-containing protein